MELASKLASALLESRDAACVNIISGLRSIYRWKGEVCDDTELLLVIKSSADRFEAIRSRIREIHTYEVPEVISVPITDGDPDYLRWLHDQVSQSG